MGANIELTNNIKTRQDFIQFLYEFQEDLRTNKSNWENIDLVSFLEALSSYAEDIDGFYINTKQDIDADRASWKVFADMLMGARIYE